MSCVCNHFAQGYTPAFEKFLSSGEQATTCCRMCTKQVGDGYLCLHCGKFFCGDETTEDIAAGDPPHFIQHYADTLPTAENRETPGVNADIHCLFASISTGVILCLECDMPIFSYEIEDKALRKHVLEVREVLKHCKNNFTEQKIQAEHVYSDINSHIGEPVYVLPVVGAPADYCFDSLARLTQDIPTDNGRDTFTSCKQELLAQDTAGSLDFMAEIIDREAPSSQPPLCLEPCKSFLRYEVPSNTFITAIRVNPPRPEVFTPIIISNEEHSSTARGKIARNLAIKKANVMAASSGGVNIASLLDVTQIRSKIMGAAEKLGINLEFKAETHAAVSVEITPNEIKETLEDLQRDRALYAIYQRLTAENAKMANLPGTPASSKKLMKTSVEILEANKTEYLKPIDLGMLTPVRVSSFTANPLTKLQDTLRKRAKEEQLKSPGIQGPLTKLFSVMAGFTASESIAPQDYGADHLSSVNLGDPSTDVSVSELTQMYTYRDSSAKALNLMNKLVNDEQMPMNRSRDIRFSTELKMDIGFARTGSNMKVHGIPKNLKFKSQARYVNLLLAHDLQVSDAKESYKDALLCFVKGETAPKMKNIKEKDCYLSYIPMNEIDSVREGPNGGGFMRNQKYIEDSTACFTCVTYFGDLELEAPNRSIRDSWVRALNFVISVLKRKM